MTASAAGNGRTRRMPRRAVEALIPPDEELGTKIESPRQIAIRRLKENRMFHVSLAILLTIIVMCLSASWFQNHWAHRSYSAQNLSGSMVMNGKKTDVIDIHGIPTVGPGLRTQYTLGADSLGRDLFMRVLKGGQISLLIGFGSAIIVMSLGLLIGTLAGFYGGKVDMIISRIVDAMLTLPSMILLIVISVALAQSPGFWFIKRGSVSMLLLFMGILGSAGFSRIVRSEAISLSKREFVEASRALGAGDVRILVRHVLPQLTSVVITFFGFLVSGGIMAEAGLSFLGVGVLPPMPSWGNIIADGQAFYSTAPWIVLIPGIFISATVVSVNLIGHALEDALDPKALGGR